MCKQKKNISLEWQQKKKKATLTNYSENQDVGYEQLYWDDWGKGESRGVTRWKIQSDIYWKAAKTQPLGPIQMDILQLTDSF